MLPRTAVILNMVAACVGWHKGLMLPIQQLRYWHRSKIRVVFRLTIHNL